MADDDQDPTGPGRPPAGADGPEGVDGAVGADGAGRADGATSDVSVGDVAELAAELRRVLLVSSRILRSHTASEDVSASQYSVLAYLQRTGQSTPGALADFEHVTPPVMTRILGRLEEAGMVTRAAHPGDGRQVRVTLTDAGEQVVLRGRAERDEWLRSRIQEAGPEERDTLREAAELLRRTLIERRD
ncbi:MarR family winged helix-turn-helix transcriptional regulator [Brachybacterium sp. GCM10030267]|uniref:MarR family winged helix-turn-helix transcriptional regulator n=1 Tax=Brachybacterium sp. GCM10030267 TaxID=3273381 RepID=UPI00360F72F6